MVSIVISRLVRISWRHHKRFNVGTNGTFLDLTRVHNKAIDIILRIARQGRVFI